MMIQLTNAEASQLTHEEESLRLIYALRDLDRAISGLPPMPSPSFGVPRRLLPVADRYRDDRPPQEWAVQQIEWILDHMHARVEGRVRPAHGPECEICLYSND